MLKIGAAIAGVLASVVLAAPAHGAMLAFVTTREGDREIYLMDDAGGSLFNVTDDFSEDYDPAWAPDGGRLVFTRDVGVDADIMVIGVDGKELEMTGRQFGVYVKLNYKVGDRVTYNLLRDGKRVDVELTLAGRP